jgi:hypothetical protein
VTLWSSREERVLAVVPVWVPFLAAGSELRRLSHQVLSLERA